MSRQVLREPWEYREADLSTSNPALEAKTKQVYFSIVARFERQADEIDMSAIEAFEPSETCEELVASIRRDLAAKKPQAALDRLHTYCMKRFASLVRKHGGGERGKNDPLHSRVAKYVNIMKREHKLTPMSERIMNTAIDNFREMNPIRNDQSLAHDNENLVGMEEARFIFDSVIAFLRFSKAVDARLFED